MQMLFSFLLVPYKTAHHGVPRVPESPLREVNRGMVPKGINNLEV